MANMMNPLGGPSILNAQQQEAPNSDTCDENDKEDRAQQDDEAPPQDTTQPQ